MTNPPVDATPPEPPPDCGSGLPPELCRAVFAGVNDGILVLDGTRITSSNHRALELLQLAHAELVGRELTDFLVTDALSPGSGTAWLQTAAGADRPLVELRLRRADGCEFDVEATVGPVSLSGEPRVLLLLRDVSERKRMQMEADIRHQQLLQADKMASLGVLVSGVAHEINNPSGLLKASLQILRPVVRDLLPILARYAEEHGDFTLGGLSRHEIHEALPGLLHDMQDGADRIANIVSELRDFARPQPSELAEDVDINAVVQAVVTLLSNMVRKSTRRFEVHFAGGLPLIRGSFQRLEQVVLNLLVNACQALEDPEQAIMVTTRNTGDWIEIEVHDEGCGIAAADLHRVTDPFFTTKREAGGTGLGLSVSSRIVADHRGQLLFASTPGKGTTATIRLPPNSAGADA